MGSKILIVEDKPDTIQMLAVWLRDEGHETVIARPGEALSAAVAVQPALILMETESPKGDGILRARELRNNPATSAIPIILLTGTNPAIARSQMLLTGAVDYVTSPINLPWLSESISRAISPDPAHVVDTQPMLREVVAAALDMAPCALAWLFGLDNANRVLVSRAVASQRGNAGIQLMSDHLGNGVTALELPLDPQVNPLVGVLFSRHAMLNFAVDQLSSKAGVQLLYQGLLALGVRVLNVFPLQIDRRLVGILLLGHELTGELGAEGWRAITTLSSQAALAVDYERVGKLLTAQEAIAREEHRFLTTVLDTMGDALIVIGDTGLIEFVNNRLLRMAEYGRWELIGQRIETLFHPDDRQALVYSLLHARGSTMKFDQRLYTKSGEVIPVLLSRSWFPRTNSAVAQQVLVLSDMTVQRNREIALERYSQQLQALNQAAEVISSSLSRQEVIKQILNSAVNTVSAQGASILLRSPDAPDVLVFVAAVGPEADRIQGMHVPVSEGVAGWVVREAKSQLVEDTSQDARFYEEVDRTSGLTTHSLIAVPLIVTEQVIGVLEVVNKRSGRFDHVDVDLLESIAGTAAVAIENARLFEQTRRRLNDLGTLLDASAAVSSTLDFGSVLELIARRLLDALAVERCEITAWDRDTGVLESLAEVVDAYWPPDRGPVSNLDDWPLRRAVLETEQCQTFGLGDPTCPASEREDLVVIGQQAALFLPLVIRHKPMGLVRVYNGLVEKLSEGDIDHIRRIVRGWLLHLEKHPQMAWHDERPLTDLCNLLHAVPGVMWVTVETWLPDRNQVQRLRETGFALWIENGGIQYSLDDYPIRKRVLAIAQPKVIERVALENDPFERAYLGRVGGEVCLLAPLLIRGQPEGLVRLVDSDPARSFDAEQVSLCQGIANVVGNAMENAHLYRSLERRAEALEAAYAELKRADQLKEDLLQNLSHEIQTPLLHVLGYIELMYSEAFGPLNLEQREKLAFVLERAQHLSELARNIITVQALQAQQLDIRPVNLEEILPQAVSAWERAASRRNITIRLRMPDGLPKIMADPRQLRLAVEHLLNNAIKFSPNGQPVDLAVEDRESVVEISVADRGVGIPKEHQDHIFKRFFQVDSGVSRKFSGAGLGLAIVQEIAAQHGGRVWVESEPGQGSVFTIRIPKAAIVTANDIHNASFGAEE